MLLRDAEVEGDRVDVRIAGDTVVEIGRGLEDTHVVDCHGGALLPGLHDHHAHVRALAARAASVSCGPPDVTDAEDLRAALTVAGSDGWVRGVGYHESVAGALDRTALDELAPDMPVRVQHRSGALWVLNSAALRAIGAEGGDGRFFRSDGWLRDRLPPTPLDLTVVGEELASHGLTGVTDATPDLDATGLDALPQHVVALGPRKILLADHAPPSHDDVARAVHRARDLGGTVAVHCVTAEAATLVLSVLEDTGAVEGDRIEHGAVLPPWTLPRLAALGLTVVTQPGFIADRGDDYLRDVAEAEHADLYRYASLRAAGVAVAPSSDTPFGPLDPWAVMAAARDRRTRSGAVLGPDECVDVGTSLAGYLASAADPGGAPRRVQPGGPADLCLLRVPLGAALADPTAGHVARTIIRGSAVYTS